MMKNNVRLKKRILFLLFVLVLALGMSSCNKAPLMTDERLTEFHARINKAGVVTPSDIKLPNRTAVIDGKEYHLEHVGSVVFDEDVYKAKAFGINHAFRDINNGAMVYFSGDKDGAEDWTGFSLRGINNIEKDLTNEEMARIALEYASERLDTEGYALKKELIDYPDVSTPLSFTFTKVIHGYETTDTFSVSVANRSLIDSFGKQTYGMFDKVSVPKIDDDLLLETLNGYVKKLYGEFIQLEVNEKRTYIDLDKDGVPFINAHVKITRNATEQEKSLNKPDIVWLETRIPVYCEDVKIS